MKQNRYVRIVASRNLKSLPATPGNKREFMFVGIFIFNTNWAYNETFLNSQ